MADLRSSGLSYQDLLRTDTRPVPDVLKQVSPPSEAIASLRVPVERYTTREFHDLEVEKVWGRAWQMACREEDIPEVGDHIVYEVGNISILVLRAAEEEFKAFHNACLHRGRKLKTCPGRSQELRCPFHGWTWNLDGTLREVPCRWDFPDVKAEEERLPEVQLGTWGGFVFVNPDPEAAPLAEFLGELPEHFERWPLEDRYKEVHVAKVMPCNWKIVQEAFMEAYHVVGTHPQLLAGIGDSNSQYDVWDNFSRAITANMTPSPHVAQAPSEQDMLDTMSGRSLDQAAMMQVSGDRTARETLAQMTRMQLQSFVPGAEQLSDAEMCDSFYYTVFPNFHPWGAYNRIIYRFRPFENDPHRSIMEVMYLMPFRGKRPPAAPIHWLGDDEDWTCASELGFLAKVFNQDTGNLAHIQRGLLATVREHIQLGRYQETKIRHFHALLERYLEA